MESFRMSNGIAFHKNELLTKKEKLKPSNQQKAELSVLVK